VGLHAEGPFVAEVDGELLYRAFENIIRNAVKFTAAGTQVDVQAELSPGAQVDSDDTPVLSLAVSKVAAPNLLAASGSVRVTSQEKLGETAFGYDANGNTTSEVSAAQSVTLTWDGENRLLTVTTDGETETYAYAATGLRRTKTTGGGTTNFVWDGVNLLAELDTSLATLAQYTDRPGQWGGLSSRRASSTSSFYGFDLAANTRVLMDGSAGVTDSYLYSAFGAELAGGTSVNPFQFAGKVAYYTDAPDRLYVRAREIAVALGRWLSTDPVPLMEPRRWSPYAYAMNKPTHYRDPSGKQVFGPGGCDVHGQPVDCEGNVIPPPVPPPPSHDAQHPPKPADPPPSARPRPPRPPGIQTSPIDYPPTDWGRRLYEEHLKELAVALADASRRCFNEHTLYTTKVVGTGGIFILKWTGRLTWHWVAVNMVVQVASTNWPAVNRCIEEAMTAVKQRQQRERQWAWDQ
ncbi:MAG: hypothetical protein HYU66_22660, partial [Armatimonadetes bacterium]|nr:hypothetical protein [Armatimonadota bacterium]